MPNYILEGESFFVLQQLDALIEGKKVEFEPEKIISGFSLFDIPDYYVFFDPVKETCESLVDKNFIICFLDKNIDQRLDYIKKLKAVATIFTYEPIPTTDFPALQTIFPFFKEVNQYYPSKKVNLKYKGSKQNYEWFDLSLINDLCSTGNVEIFKEMSESYFDIWKFLDLLWSKNSTCLDQINYIDNRNFEEYFNRIRETMKDYIEVLQTDADTFEKHHELISNPIVNNGFRFLKVKEKLTKLNKNSRIEALCLFDRCLKNVRAGSNAKLELIALFLSFKNNVL